MPLQQHRSFSTWLGHLFFQTPQSGQCLCNTIREGASFDATFAFRPLNRGNASATLLSFPYGSSSQDLSDPSIGAMPLQQRHLLTRQKASPNFQTPQSGQCLCNIARVILLHTPLQAFRPLNRGNASATTLMLGDSCERMAAFRPLNRGNASATWTSAIRVGSETPFRPLNRGNASATNEKSQHILSQDPRLSDPSIGAMPLQPSVGCVKPGVRTAFRPLNRGNASATRHSRAHDFRILLFQTPQSGQCLCNFVGWWLGLLWLNVFQTPQSGQCLCNRIEEVAQAAGLDLSDPSIGAMPLQRKCHIVPLFPRKLSDPSIGAMPLQHVLRLFCRLLQFVLSDPSIGAMPLQLSHPVTPPVRMTSFRPLNRGNASATLALRLFPRSRSVFQTPQSGQCLCNLPDSPQLPLARVFQTPQSGQCLCNGPAPGGLSLVCVLSDPSIGAMPLQPELSPSLASRL